MAPSDWSDPMTKEQKHLIDQYRQSGMKYSEIPVEQQFGSEDPAEQRVHGLYDQL